MTLEKIKFFAVLAFFARTLSCRSLIRVSRQDAKYRKDAKKNCNWASLKV